MTTQVQKPMRNAKKTVATSPSVAKKQRKEKNESFYVKDSDFDSFSMYDYSTEYENYLSTKYED